MDTSQSQDEYQDVDYDFEFMCTPEEHLSSKILWHVPPLEHITKIFITKEEFQSLECNVDLLIYRLTSLNTNVCNVVHFEEL